MPILSATDPTADTVRSLYVRAISALNTANVPFLVGGTHALSHYTGIARDSKDFDIFVRRSDFERVMQVLAQSGFRTDLTYPHWLGKATSEEGFVDVIFSSGNGISAVDDEWFENAADGFAFGVPVKLSPAEEMVWSKAYVMERERFDGADVMHLLLARAEQFDWARLVRRFGPHWRVLLAHLCLFGFIYPSERHRIPAWTMRGLMGRLDHEMRVETATERIVNGTLVSREQYLHDIESLGFKDARLTEVSAMTDSDIEAWTQAISGGRPES
jgi:hypothetical protein